MRRDTNILTGGACEYGESKGQEARSSTGTEQSRRSGGGGGGGASARAASPARASAGRPRGAASGLGLGTWARPPRFKAVGPLVPRLWAYELGSAQDVKRISDDLSDLQSKSALQVEQEGPIGYRSPPVEERRDEGIVWAGSGRAYVAASTTCRCRGKVTKESRATARRARQGKGHERRLAASVGPVCRRANLAESAGSVHPLKRSPSPAAPRRGADVVIKVVKEGACEGKKSAMEVASTGCVCGSTEMMRQGRGRRDGRRPAYHSFSRSNRSRVVIASPTSFCALTRM